MLNSMCSVVHGAQKGVIIKLKEIPLVVLVINQPFQALLGGIELMHAGSDMVRDIVLCCLNVLVKLDFSRSVEQVQLRVECVVALALADTAGIVC